MKYPPLHFQQAWPFTKINFNGARFILPIIFAVLIALNFTVINLFQAVVHMLPICLPAVIALGVAYMHLKYTAALKAENQHLRKLACYQDTLIGSAQQQFNDLAHVISHDLKEPLRSISGFAYLVTKKVGEAGLDDTDVTEYVSHIHTGVHRLNALLKSTAGYLTIDFRKSAYKTVSMQSLVKRAAASIFPENGGQKAEVVIHPLKDVLGDSEMLEEVFGQLFGNAIKFKHPDHTPRIEVGCRQANRFIEYYVRDNGIGISKKYYQRIFQAFQCLQARDTGYNVGTGLAICKKIITLHGGDIRVSSREGAGSTFYFTLPRADG